MADRRTTRVRRAVALVVAIGVGSLTACGDLADHSMCTVYDDYLGSVAAVQAIDPQAESAAAATEVAEAYLDSVRRLREVVDDRHSALLANLEEAARDVVRTLQSVPDDADYSIWVPLVEESLVDVGNAAVSVRDALEPQCPGSGDEG